MHRFLRRFCWVCSGNGPPGHGAFFGLLSGTAAAAMTHGLTLAEGKDAWLGQCLPGVSLDDGAKLLDRNGQLGYKP